MIVALYFNQAGEPVIHGSYSSRETFRYCPQKFYLSRTVGWRNKEQRVSTWFGKAVEAAVEWYEKNHRREGCGIERFVQFWEDVKKLKEYPELTYTDREGDWDSLRAGIEMLTIYALRAPYLPISQDPPARFQVPAYKKIFPGSELDVLQNKAFLDIVSLPKWDHPLLPAIEKPAVDLLRPLIIDIKVMGSYLDGDLVMLDPQLREYAWQLRYADIAFLWFFKAGHGLEKGSRITTLEQIETLAPGTEWRVLRYDDDLRCAYLGSNATFDAYCEAIKGLRGKAADQVKDAFVFTDPRVTPAMPCQISKQRLQFAAARMTDAMMDEVGRSVAQDTVEMVQAAKTGFYPKTGGIRFPNQKCMFCDFRGNCLENDQLRDSLVFKSGEEWLDGNVSED